MFTSLQARFLHWFLKRFDAKLRREFPTGTLVYVGRGNSINNVDVIRWEGGVHPWCLPVMFCNGNVWWHPVWTIRKTPPDSQLISYHPGREYLKRIENVSA